MMLPGWWNADEKPDEKCRKSHKSESREWSKKRAREVNFCSYVIEINSSNAARQEALKIPSRICQLKNNNWESVCVN